MGFFLFTLIIHLYRIYLLFGFPFLIKPWNYWFVLSHHPIFWRYQNQLISIASQLDLSKTNYHYNILLHTFSILGFLSLSILMRYWKIDTPCLNVAILLFLKYYFSSSPHTKLLDTEAIAFELTSSLMGFSGVPAPSRTPN